ncbi:Strictosidine synthase [Melia azedarach]|uniref:Strictosidine synthase n=1 Tax=Melia azedarach TaxID=155640 RepID=A0ACC1XPG3_MELAZ|nr:Strictosidine synthase [Melia azedarach]
MLSLLILLFSFPPIVLSANFFTILPLPSTTVGPEAFVFDSSGAGPYTGVSDGRILKYQGPNVGFVDFAYTSPKRSKALCDGTNNIVLGPKCGRPLGLGFNNATNELYIADAYFGLLVVGKNGGLATQLATSADGVPFRFPDGLDVDPVTGDVYFTDASAVFSISQIFLAVSIGDSTGRLLKYDPRTKQVKVLLKGLQGPAGVAVSADGGFLLVTEFIGERIRKYWIKGPKANTSEILVSLRGRPDNIKRTAAGDFWAAVNLQNTTIVTLPAGIRLNANGNITNIVMLSAQYKTTLISEVQEFSGSLYIGSMFTNFVGVLAS